VKRILSWRRHQVDNEYSAFSTRCSHFHTCTKKQIQTEEVSGFGVV